MPAGLPRAGLALTGDSEPPALTVTGPAGERLDADPAAPGQQADKRYFVAADPASSTTYVLIDEPSAGTWRVAPVAGSELTGTQVAKALPAPPVAADVTPGDGGQSTLSWDLVPTEGQIVREIGSAP